MTATAVSSVAHHQAGMAAADNNAFRQVGAALGPAALGALLSSEAVDALPGHLADAGLTEATVRHATAVADTGGPSALGGTDFGAGTPRVLGALSEAFLDGLRLCLIVSAVLVLLAAVVGVFLLRRPQHPAPPATGGYSAVHGRHAAGNPGTTGRAPAQPQGPGAHAPAPGSALQANHQEG